MSITFCPHGAPSTSTRCTSSSPNIFLMCYTLKCQIVEDGHNTNKVGIQYLVSVSYGRTTRDKANTIITMNVAQTPQSSHDKSNI
jgi:hypothetical protein